MAFINNNSNPKPKKLRIPPNLLPHLQCIAAYTTRNAILTRYAEHKGEEVKPVSKEDIINLISDAVIALEHVFLMKIDTSTKIALLSLLTKIDR